MIQDERHDNVGMIERVMWSGFRRRKISSKASCKLFFASFQDLQNKYTNNHVGLCYTLFIDPMSGSVSVSCLSYVKK